MSKRPRKAATYRAARRNASVHVRTLARKAKRKTEKIRK